MKKLAVPKSWAERLNPALKGEIQISNPASSGTRPIKAVARGETTVSISFVHDGSGEKMNGFTVETVTPSEGAAA